MIGGVGFVSVPAERRRHPRFEIELSGLIGEADGAKERCVVRDYCQGGFLVERADGKGSLLKPKQQVRIDADLVTARGKHPFGVKATVCWVHGNQIGVELARPSPAIVEILNQHRRHTTGDDEPTAPSSSEGRAIARMRYVAKGLLPNIVRELMTLIRESMLDALDGVKSDVEQHQVLADMSSLDELRQGNRLINAILDRTGEPGLADVNNDKPDDDELRLVDRDEFERWLEASRVATILDRELNDQLGAIGSRLAALRGVDDEVSIRLPFEPQHFTGALKSIAADLEFCPTTRRVVFDSARDVLLARLGGFYTELDGALDKAGAPASGKAQKLAVVRKAVQSMSTGGGTRDQSEPDDAEAAVADAVDAGQPAIDIGQPPAGTTVSVDRGQLEALLAREQDNREQQARQMMQHVLESPSVGSRFEEWMALLNEPMVELARADRTFFRNPEHPLREIVDSLGHLHMFRPDSAVDDNDPMDQRISALLKEISDGRTDAASLRSVSEEINGITAEKSLRFQQNSERVVEAAEGRDQVRRAHTETVQQINHRYAGRRVPTLLQDILDGGWVAVLKLALLNGAEHAARYAENLAVLDDLVRLLGGDAFEGDREPSSAFTVLRKFNEELASVSFDPFRRNEIERRVRQQIAQQARTPAKLVKMAPLHAWPDQAEVESRPEGLTANAWQRLLARCDAIEVGDVLRFANDEDPLDLHVAWIRDDRRLFVLVDHRGLRDREITRHELALGLHRRKIEQVMADGRPVSERAIDDLLERMEQQLAHQAAHDSLTGLINRQQFQAVIERELGDGQGDPPVAALLWIDLAQFRLVNDIHGYDTGDRLLMAVARALETVAVGSVAGHLGADRFALLLRDTELGAAEASAKQAGAAIADIPFEIDGQSLSLGVSIGVVELAIGEGSVSNLIRAAESAVAAAKLAGGGVYVYREDDPDIVRRRQSVQWVAQVDEALEHGRLHLRCQPIVPVNEGSGLSPHYEILLGVADASGEALSIVEFIEAAESYNRMRAVDRWVTRTVIDSIAQNRHQMSELHGFAVNLSGQTASDPGFVDYVREHLQRTGIDPEWLSFEVTETAAVTDLTSSANIVHDLKAMGFKVALDDFGSGLASYAYLKELPVDWLKIDGAFVRKIAADREDYEVVKSINDIGHFLGKETIAEYVADREILRLVREIGVDYAQGYEISPPLLLDDLMRQCSKTA